MARPCCCRRIEGKPASPVFKPAGVPIRGLEEVVITLDEVEAVRLADLDGLYQEQAAVRMEVSRPTFSRIVESAHRKIAEALIQGKALKIEGGVVSMGRPDVSRCRRWRNEEKNIQGTDEALENGKTCCGRPRRRSDCGAPRPKTVASPESLKQAGKNR
ncbi:MAG: DUF134 domain-containing protein [bacterium]|nr:DUF134 domain-containing protein [bacterium]